MGAINYGTSDYITIGYNCNNIDYDDEFYNDYIQDDYDQVKWTLEKYDFYYFHVTLEPGYYEGFYINIEFNFKYCFDRWEEKINAQKEITQIKKFLLEIINDFGLCAVFPGWCMGYANYKDTLKELNNAIKEMRQEVKNTYTYHTLPESEKIPLW